MIVVRHVFNNSLSNEFNLFSALASRINRMYFSTKPKNGDEESSSSEKLTTKLRAKTPIGKLDELDAGKHPFQEKEPLREWPDNTNPHTGEVGGPRGPEPTRYGDWERKGRVTDF